LVAAALRFGSPRPGSGAETDGHGCRVGLIAFAATAVHFVSVYALPSSGLPWPLSVVLVLVPIAAGVAVIRRRAAGGPYGADALRVIAGMFAWFLLVDALSGLAGRVDLTLGALAGAYVLRRWLRACESVAPG